jgi:hypothetical protein
MKMKINNLLLKLLLLIQLMAFFVIDAQAHDKNEPIGNKCGFPNMCNKDKREKLLRHVIWDEDTLPAANQKITISPNNLFAIHYDTTGFNAPSSVDLNRNGISDYVDSVCFYFERAYYIQVNSIGYKSPIPDRGGRGTPQYDIYLWDLGNSDADTSDPNYDNGGNYGFTMWQDSDAIYPTGKYPRSYSYIVIDNDFSPKDSVRPKSSINVKPRKAFTETGINALKITASHEFQHAIQLMYGNTNSTTIMEMCGVSMEYRLYPETKDYLQYVSNLFKNSSVYPFGIDNTQAGYGFSIFARFLIQNYGDQPLKRMWELVGDEVNPYKALDSSLNELGTSLDTDWRKFLDWCYYTGERAVEGKYFTDAKQLPEITFFTIQNYTPPSASESRELRPLEIRALRFNFKGLGNNSNDTLDIMLGNIDLGSAISGFILKTIYEIQVSGEQVSGSEKIEGINYYYKDTYDKQKVILNKYIRPGTVTSGIDYAYPNPFNPNDGIPILFPVPENALLYDEADLNVYTADMIPIYSEKLKVIAYNKHRVVIWDKIPSDIMSGIYIFGVRNKEDVKLGKFSVIRK